MPDFDFHTLDVFTDTVFGGNPLGVFPDALGMDDSTMQRIARELNLSETVFILPAESGGDLKVRIFTPGKEVPFAGHPTVGTAVFAVNAGLAGGLSDGDHAVVLEEGVGPVQVVVTVQDGVAVTARLTAAVAPTEIAFEGSVAECAAMIGLAEEEVAGVPEADEWSALGPLARGRLVPGWASAGLDFFVVPVRSRAAVARAALDSAVWARILPAGSPSTMVYVVAPGDGETDLHVRMFAPDIGVPEDPATGSACAALGGWLGARLPPGSWQWTVAQGVEMGRPSRLDLAVEVVDEGVDAIQVGGGAVRVTSGVMRVP